MVLEVLKFEENKTINPAFIMTVDGKSTPIPLADVPEKMRDKYEEVQSIWAHFRVIEAQAVGGAASAAPKGALLKRVYKNWPKGGWSSLGRDTAKMFGPALSRVDDGAGGTRPATETESATILAGIIQENAASGVLVRCTLKLVDGKVYPNFSYMGDDPRNSDEEQAKRAAVYAAESAKSAKVT
jgi:hypothetical protein